MKQSTPFASSSTRSHVGMFDVPGLDSIYVSSDTTGNTGPTPSDVLAGFDAVVQCSRDLMQAAMTQSLSAKGLATLATQIPWSSASPSAPPLLRAAVFALFRQGGAQWFGEQRLEVRLVGPYLAALRWPDLISQPPVPPVISGRAAKTTVLARQMTDRYVDVSWRLEVNLLIAGLPASAGEVAMSFASASAKTAPGRLTPPHVGPFSLSPDSASSESGATWQRIPLGIGKASTIATANTVTTQNRLQFGVELDFPDQPPAVSSDDPMVSELLDTPYCTGLLAQALAPLYSATGVQLTPTISPAGALSLSQIQQMNMPVLQVQDALLTDSQGAPLLGLCVEVGTHSLGVLRLVPPFLDANDFAYAVSMNLLGSALKAQWQAQGAGLTFIRNVPVELRVSEDSDETATGTARVHVLYSRTVHQTTIRPADRATGDAIRFLSEQTITLLGLWDYQGRQITDLGPLAEPQTTPFPLFLNPFEEVPPNSQAQLDPVFASFIGKVLMTTAYPIQGRFRVGKITGRTSSATQSLLARWRLKGLLDDLILPANISVEGVA